MAFIETLEDKGSKKRYRFSFKTEYFWNKNRVYEALLLSKDEIEPSDIKSIANAVLEQKKSWCRCNSRKGYAFETVLVKYPRTNIYIKEIKADQE